MKTQAKTRKLFGNKTHRLVGKKTLALLLAAMMALGMLPLLLGAGDGNVTYTSVGGSVSEATRTTFKFDANVEAVINALTDGDHEETLTLLSTTIIYYEDGDDIYFDVGGTGNSFGIVGSTGNGATHDGTALFRADAFLNILNDVLDDWAWGYTDDGELTAEAKTAGAPGGTGPASPTGTLAASEAFSGGTDWKAGGSPGPVAIANLVPGTDAGNQPARVTLDFGTNVGADLDGAIITIEGKKLILTTREVIDLSGAGNANAIAAAVSGALTGAGISGFTVGGTAPEVTLTEGTPAGNTAALHLYRTGGFTATSTRGMPGGYTWFNFDRTVNVYEAISALNDNDGGKTITVLGTTLTYVDDGTADAYFYDGGTGQKFGVVGNASEYATANRTGAFVSALHHYAPTTWDWMWYGWGSGPSALGAEAKATGDTALPTGNMTASAAFDGGANWNGTPVTVDATHSEVGDPNVPAKVTLDFTGVDDPAALNGALLDVADARFIMSDGSDVYVKIAAADTASDVAGKVVAAVNANKAALGVTDFTASATAGVVTILEDSPTGTTAALDVRFTPRPGGPLPPPGGNQPPPRTGGGGGGGARAPFTSSKTDPEEKFVDVLYMGLLGRKYDAAGFAFWVEQLESGKMTYAQVARHFIFSEEVKAAGFTDVQFVTRLYNGLLGRSPDQGGLDFWAAHLGRSVSKEAIFNAFIASGEVAARLTALGLKV